MPGRTPRPCGRAPRRPSRTSRRTGRRTWPRPSGGCRPAAHRPARRPPASRSAPTGAVSPASPSGYTGQGGGQINDEDADPHDRESYPGRHSAVPLTGWLLLGQVGGTAYRTIRSARPPLGRCPGQGLIPAGLALTWANELRAGTAPISSTATSHFLVSNSAFQRIARWSPRITATPG